jgi:isoleucyl-tRNA synthetase
MNHTPDTQEKSAVALREEATVTFWKEHNLFDKSVTKEAPKGDLVFYDGPPFATGLPHYGHILGGTGKDAIARYKTMQGFHVPRKWGWDTHGLPIETIVEKSLGITSKKQIEEMGLDAFSREARSKVLGFVADWKKTVDRTARWVDFDGSYKTMDTTFIESVWWAMGELNKKGLIYEADRILPYCPRCQTPLANAEIAMDNSYKDIVDISVYVKMQLVDRENEYLLAWTTTPWTLPGNTALAVNTELGYVKVSFEGGFYYVGKDRYEAVFKDKDAQVVEEVSGSALVGRSYKPPFDYFTTTDIAEKGTAWKVYAADFVTADTGTGIVHIAPSFGEDDAALAKKENIPSIKHVGPDGTFIPAVTHFAGVQVKPKEDHQAADVEIIKYLAHNHLLFAKEKITHSYPHCYRCDTPLLYYGLSSWFIKVQDFKKRMLELNQGITWVPEHLRDGRFKHVLENAPDWNFSRNRFWASPLPIWKSKTGKMKFIGSVEELRAHAKPARNRYTLIRHGQAKSNITNTWDCGRDPENHLTDEGKGGVAESAARLKDAKIDLIVASPFLRAQETAAIVAEALGLSAADVIIDDRLSEWNVGTEFDRKTLDYFFDVRNAAHNRYSYEAHGGESFASVVKRCGECLYSLEERYEGKNILIVGHGSSIRALENVAEGFTYDQLLKREAKALNYKNAEFRSLDFKPLSHNENYELDLHRPYIDAVKLEIDGEEYTRIPEVIDCWFESGSMPFAQDHYPFERPDWMEKNFPADFVVEYIAQTRTWFYYTLLLSTMLFDRVPFTHVVTTGNLNGTDGQKMSKSKGNYPDPWILMNKYGADALRMYLMSSVLMKGEDSNFMEKSVDEIYKKIILRLENCLSFIDMYEVPKQVWGQGEAPTSELDRWIIARLSQVVAEMTTGFDGYNTVEATKGINLFVDDLSAWYLRRSRDRFKGDDVMDRTSAGKTLVTVLVEFAKAIAPVMPFIAETVYQKLRTADSKESVHLEAFPTAGEANESLLGTMQHVRDTVTLGLEARSKANIKVRQPLAKIAITIDWFDDECLSIIKDELNVKEVVVDKFLAEGTVALDTDITDALRDEGDMREMVRTIQDMRKAAGLMPSDRVTVLMTDPEPAWYAALGAELRSSVGAEKIVWGEGEAKVEKV